MPRANVSQHYSRPKDLLAPIQLVGRRGAYGRARAVPVADGPSSSACVPNQLEKIGPVRDGLTGVELALK